MMEIQKGQQPPEFKHSPSRKIDQEIKLLPERKYYKSRQRMIWDLSLGIFWF